MNPAFHKSMPIKMFTTLTHKVFDVLDEANEKPINATKVMERFTLNAISLAAGKAAFKKTGIFFFLIFFNFFFCIFIFL